jgi:hypothetical protein
MLVALETPSNNRMLLCGGTHLYAGIQIQHALYMTVQHHCRGCLIPFIQFSTSRTWRKMPRTCSPIFRMHSPAPVRLSDIFASNADLRRSSAPLHLLLTSTRLCCAAPPLLRIFCSPLLDCTAPLLRSFVSSARLCSPLRTTCLCTSQFAGSTRACGRGRILC